MLKAKGARIEERSGRIYFTQPDVTFYDNAAVTSVITAVSGEMKVREKEAVLTGDVRVDARREGMKLATNKLYYSSARAKIWTDERVVIHRGKTVITGSGFTANPDLSEIELTKQETRMGGE